MTPTPFNVGAYVPGAPTSPRALVRHADLLAAYADGAMLDRDATGEAYLSHFAFGPDLQAHYAANRNSVAGFAGPCWCRWLVLDIDPTDPADALADARKLVSFLHDRYPESEGAVPVYFSGGKGFHVLVELAHNPPPAVGFQRPSKALAVALANAAGVTIDPSVYDIAHIIRLPNTRHPRTGCSIAASTPTRCSGSTSTASAGTPRTRPATACPPRGRARRNSPPTGTRRGK